MTLKRTMRLFSTAVCAGTLVSSLYAADTKKAPELTGHVAFDVESRSGRVETLEVTIGDGGTGPYKAVLTGDPHTDACGLASARPQAVQQNSAASDRGLWERRLSQHIG